MSDVITLTLLRLRSAPNPLQSSWRVVSDMMVDLLLSPTIQVSIRDYFGRYLESRSRRVESSQSRVVVESSQLDPLWPLPRAVPIPVSCRYPAYLLD